jgi:PAS domain S-box-containing protein
MGQRSIEDLVALPLMSAPEWQATMDVLSAAVSPALFTDRNLLCLVICRMANLSLEHGNSDGSCFAYAWLGMLLGPLFGEYRAAFRFGKLGLDLVEQQPLRRFEARVYLIFGHRVIPWTQPIRTGAPFVRRAFDAASKLGDLTFAAYSCDNLVTHLLATGHPLGDVQRQAEAGLEFARRVRFNLVVDRITTQLRLIRALRGHTPQLASFNDAEFNEVRFELHLAKDRRPSIAACWYWIRKLQAGVFAGDYGSAITAAQNAEGLLWTSPSFFELAEYHLYAALAQAALCETATPAERTTHLGALAAHHLQLQEWAENCPENFENRAALVGAEIARIEGRVLDAMQLYERAIRSARQNGFVHNEALACETASRFHMARGFDEIAALYHRNARAGYQRWGAEGKVRQLDELYPRPAHQDRPQSATSTIEAPVEQLDLATVIQLSQAVSSEIFLDRLIDKLLRTALSQAGAERGLLILLREADPRIEAEAATQADAIEVQLGDRPATADLVPHSVLHHVLRTREQVILDDAGAYPPFAGDPYFQRRRVRSVLCLPLITQVKLSGVLYFENGPTVRAFAPQRAAVLGLIASQAAVALENARLYRDLEQREARIVRLVDANIIGIFFWRSGVVIEANDTFLHMLGFERADLGRIRWRDQTPSEWHGDQMHAEQELFRTGRSQPFEKEYFRKDGTRVPVLVGSALFEEQNGIRTGVSFVLDLTERKRAEAEARDSEQRYRALQAEMAHANRVATMGQLTGSIAHEISQPVGATIIGAKAALRWLGREPPNLDEVRQSLDQIVKDGTRAGDVIGRIRDLIKKAPLRQDVLAIGSLVRDVVELTHGEATKHGVSITLELAEGLPLIRGDRVQLQQVILNLIVNAIEAMGGVSDGARRLTISAAEGKAGDLLVAVRDSGPGLPMTTPERIFEPFYTTKAAGLGMGLSLCRSIIEAHGGRLWATANEPSGAAIQFVLPSWARSIDLE